MIRSNTASTETLIILFTVHTSILTLPCLSLLVLLFIVVFHAVAHMINQLGLAWEPLLTLCAPVTTVKNYLKK